MWKGQWGALVLTLAAVAALRAEGTADDARARGEALLAQGNWQAAEVALEGAVEAAPDDARAWGLLGTTRNALSKYLEGAQACERALALDPSNLRARFDLGVSRFNVSRSAEAASSFDAVLAADPKHADATWMRGHCALRAAEWDLAARLFVAAAERRPDCYGALGQLYAGIALASAGKKEEASSRLEEAVQAAPRGAVGVMAQACRERLLDPTPCETLLRPEDYLPSPGEHACAAQLDLPIGRGGPTWAKVILSSDFSLRMDRPVAGLSKRGFLQAIDLLSLQSQAAKSGVEALVMAGPSISAPDLLLLGHRDPPSHDPWARLSLLLVLAAGIGVSDGTDGALAAALEGQKDAVAAAKDAGVWGPLLAAERAETAASCLGAEAVLRRRPESEGDVCRVLVAAGLSAGRKRLECIDIIARLSGCEPGANDSSPAGLSQARALALAARWEEVEAVLAGRGDSWEAAELLALCHSQGARWAEAESAFRRALAARPERSAFHRFHIGLCLHALGKTQEARAEWRACAEASHASYYGLLARGLCTPWAEAQARRGAASNAATAAVEKLARGWGAIARIEALPQHQAAGALLGWLEAARTRGGELGAALGAELTEARRAACCDPAAADLLDEALRQARDDVRDAKGEDAMAAAAREKLLEVMRRSLSPQK